MIIVRSPLRITLGGGGTDLPSYYRNHGGFIVSAAINKYVYIAVNESFRPKINLKYSKVESVDTVDQVEHPVIREALRLLHVPGPIDINVISDIPHGTGMGSSGSFTTGLLQALHMYRREVLTKEQLAEEAFYIEHDVLGQHCGRQDQYIAAIGGVTCFTFARNGVITHAPLQMKQETLANLEDNLLLFFTGYTRVASGILIDQDMRSQNHDAVMIENLDTIKELGFRSRDALESGNLQEFATRMHEHWTYKRSRFVNGMTNDHIDELYQLGLDNGALGGKLVGAGGGGFLMFYTENKAKLRRAMYGAGLREVRIQFDFEGTSTVAHS
jgi:D-glycero-alpha-D-manno-heptose-7-phosphate kinase